MNEYEFDCGCSGGGFGAFFAPCPASARSAAAFASRAVGHVHEDLDTRRSAFAFETPSTAITRSLATAGPAVASSPTSATAPAIARIPCFISTSRVEL